jgi:hypothetical protein
MVSCISVRKWWSYLRCLDLSCFVSCSNNNSVTSLRSSWSESCTPQNPCIFRGSFMLADFQVAPPSVLTSTLDIPLSPAKAIPATNCIGISHYLILYIRIILSHISKLNHSHNFIMIVILILTIPVHQH